VEAAETAASSQRGSNLNGTEVSNWYERLNNYFIPGIFGAQNQHINKTKYLENFLFLTQSVYHNSHNNNLSHNIHPHRRISNKKKDFNFLLIIQYSLISLNNSVN